MYLHPEAPAFLEKNKKYKPLILSLCLIAVIRVFLYSAAFPFFNNVDEETHLDLIVKYSHAKVPRSYELIGSESAALIAGNKSPEYFWIHSDFPDGKLPLPLWKQDAHTAKQKLEENHEYWIQIPNHESLQPPLYYAIAGLWFKCGSLIGFKGLTLLYWSRFLNLLFIASLVWLAYLVALEVFPENSVGKIGLPLLVAIWPQDIFYSLQNDVLSPLCVGACIFFLLRSIREKFVERKLILYAAFSAAAAVLVKTSNLPVIILVVAGISVIILKRKRYNEKQLWRFVFLFLTCMIIPVCAWCMWNVSNGHDLLASNEKMKMLDWKYKPIGEWFDSALFSINGMFDFWTELMASFWRGEFSWSRQRLASAYMDVFYWGSSLIFILLSFFYLRKNKSTINTYPLILLCFASYLIFIFILSMSIDFGTCFYPSKEKPYFTSGRLISGAIIPFMALYLKGFEVMFSWLKNGKVKLGILILIAVFITVSEAKINSVTWHSCYNFLGYFSLN